MATVAAESLGQHSDADLIILLVDMRHFMCLPIAVGLRALF
jgi:hypothetical protein